MCTFATLVMNIYRVYHATTLAHLSRRRLGKFMPLRHRLAAQSLCVYLPLGNFFSEFVGLCGTGIFSRFKCRKQNHSFLALLSDDWLLRRLQYVFHLFCGNVSAFASGKYNLCGCQYFIERFSLPCRNFYWNEANAVCLVATSDTIAWSNRIANSHQSIIFSYFISAFLNASICGTVCFLSPTTTSSISSGRIYFSAISRTCSGVTAWMFFT